jgi:hypothetical protein
VSKDAVVGPTERNVGGAISTNGICIERSGGCRAMGASKPCQRRSALIGEDDGPSKTGRTVSPPPEAFERRAPICHTRRT